MRRIAVLSLVILLAGCQSWSKTPDWKNELDAGHRAMGEKNYSEAELHYKKSLSFAEGFPGHWGDELVSTVLNNLEWPLRKQEKWPEAEAVIRRNIALHMKLKGPDSKETGWRVGDLAELLEQLGRYHESELSYRECLRVMRLSYSPRHHSIASTSNGLGRVVLAQGDTTSADSCFRLALTILRTSRLPTFELPRDLRKYADFCDIRGRMEASSAARSEADSLDKVIQQRSEKIQNADTTSKS